MFEATVAFSSETDSSKAGTSLSAEIIDGLRGQTPDVLIVFASSRHNYQALLKSLESGCRPKHIVGCSSAGEFVRGTKGEGAVSAMALRSSELHFSSGLGRGLRKSREKAAHELVSSFQGGSTSDLPYRSVLLLADALAGHTDELIESLTALTSGGYQFFGGGAGDDGKFASTHVFLGTEAITDAVVGLEILSPKPIGIGVQHGWEPTGELMRVTETEGMKLISLNAVPAAEAFSEYAGKTGQKFDPKDPIPFFLHNTLAMQTRGGYKLRMPLSVLPDGSILCASNVPPGATVSFMKATSQCSVDAAETAVHSALQQLEGQKPKAALFFDCVATRLRMGTNFGLELNSLQNALGPDVQLAGCNTYGQIARVDGQFSGFHNCTAVVCVFPEQ